MKKIIAVLLIFVMLLGLSSCSLLQSEVTLHIAPMIDYSEKKEAEIEADGASNGQEIIWIIQADEAADYSDGYTVNSKIHSNKVTVKYDIGDTIYDVVTNRIYITEPERRADVNKKEDIKALEGKEVDFVEILVYLTRYGIPGLRFSTVNDKTKAFTDWNRLVMTKDLYIWVE